ncbi:uncharacterized protein LOC111865601 isoform X2 [Cryptotermes secundus]|uniref:uncharacterized protein LOC111865601 isoform X2 n=1 Tax=Cryptotermes secundus TaxID=105785 RepID=UPI000CD7D848|nr:uncharacterized protein LOC111865601 isoform X2 [Cryptotermes secundus]
MGNIFFTSQHERNEYSMFSNNKVSKNIHQIGSHRSSLRDRYRECSFPPSKKPRLDDGSTSRQARVDDDVWGEDLDANTVEECFILASQALSQACTQETSRAKEEAQTGELASVQTGVEDLQTSAAQPLKPKQTSAFTRNFPSTSKWTGTCPKKSPSTTAPSNVFPRNGPLSSRHPEVFPKDVKRPSVMSKSKHAAILPTNAQSSTEQVEMVQQNAVSFNSRTLPGNVQISASPFSSMNNVNTVIDANGRDLLVRELQQLRLAYQKLQDHTLTKEGEVSILRSQLNSKNAEVEMERLMRAQELESQAQEQRDKLKELQKELEHTKTQLEFKTLEVGSALERCRLLESQSKVKLVEPQPSQTPPKFPKKLPMTESASTTAAPQTRAPAPSLKPVKLEIHVAEGPMLSRLVTPALFEKPMRGTETISCLGIKQEPVPTGEYGKNLTPWGSTVNVTHTSVSKLILMDSLGSDSAHQLIQKVVRQCYLMLVKQRDLLELHKPPENRDKLKEHDLKVSEAAGALFGDKPSLMIASPWYKNEQGVETRRALGLMGALALVSQYAAQYMSGMIQCEKCVTIKKLRKKKPPQGNPVCRKWLEPCKTVQQSRLKPAPMSNKVRKIVEQRILTNLAISRARASIRAAKREKARLEAERVNVGLEQETSLSEPDNPKSSKVSRRPPNLLVVYRKYLERCKAVSHAKIKPFCQDSMSQNLTYLTTEPGPSSMSDQPNVTCAGQSLKCHQVADRRKAAGKCVSDESLQDSCSKLSSTSVPKCALKTKHHSKKMQKSVNREIEDSEESDQLDQPGTSKQSHPNDDHVFKKPLPVKPQSPRHRTALKEVGKQKVQVRNGGCQAIKKITAAGRKFPLSKYLHSSVLAAQRRDIARIMKLLSEKGRLQKRKPNVGKKLGKPGKAADLFKTLHDIVLFICEQRLSLKFNGVLLGVTHLLRVISCKVEFKEDRCPLLAKILQDLLLCRPSVNVLMELTELLFSLGKYCSIMATLCHGTGPSPYLGGTIGAVYFVKGKPRYDLGSNEEVEYFGNDSCMIPLLCWMLLVQRAGIEQYVVLTSRLIKWLMCVSRHQEEGPYWIGSNDPETETRDCQCRARIVEAVIMLLHLCYSHIRKNNFQGDQLFHDIRHLLGRGLVFLHRLVHQDADVGLLMANAEGEYQVLIHGLIDNLKFMNFSKQEEEALKVLKDLEDQQVAHSPTLSYTEPARMMMDDIFKTIKSFCGPSYK